MGCNCKANESIRKITKKYGKETYLSFKEKIIFRTEESVKFLLLLLLVIIASPIILIVLVILIIIGKYNINIDNVLNILLRRNKDE